jgi:phospholipid-binding lipoprotein MlaA
MRTEQRMSGDRTRVAGGSRAGARRIAVVAGALALLGAAEARAAEAAEAASPSAGDPWEGFNRSMYRFGMGLDRVTTRPLAHAYMGVTTPPVRRGVHNVLQNLRAPMIFINDVLQLRPQRAGRTAGRFLANSTLGVGGIFDVAARDGQPHRDNDFGATLAHYGVGSGPYLFVPLLGPSNVRDLTGFTVDFFADPVFEIRYHGSGTVNLTRTTLGVMDRRAAVDADLEAVQRTAADPYATIRSVYNQQRAAELTGGESAVEDLPDIPAVDPAPSPPVAN